MELDADFIAFCKQSVALEQRMAKQAGTRLNEAMRNNIQDINVLDRIADQLLDTMSGLSGAGERTYMKYIKYLGTFNPQAAKETKDAYEDIMGYKIHVAYAAARLAKELHKEQVDQAGKDYFEEHLSTVGRNGFDWKEKTVGFLFNAAEDTGHTVKEIIRKLKAILDDWEQNKEKHDWIYEFEDIVGSFPNEKYHKLTKQEWDEIEEALDLMDFRTTTNRETYIERFRGHRLAIKVKLNDLQYNMDITRILHPTDKDVAKMERHKKEYYLLLKMLAD